jgi:hypothetical protein
LNMRLFGKATQARRLAIEHLEARQVLSVSIQVDFSFDTSGFFDTTLKRDVAQRAADAVASRLEDVLTALQPSGDNRWTARFAHPATGADQSIENLGIPTDTMVVFVGGREMLELATGGPGGWDASGDVGWLDTVAARGQLGALSPIPTDFGPWGGSVSFDLTLPDGATWHFGAPGDALAPSEYDFYSVAVHEFVHVLGFGTAPSWDVLIAAQSFIGAHSTDEHDAGGSVPLESDLSHWLDGTTDQNVETAMDPTLSIGAAKGLTPLDFAALQDVGWIIRRESQGDEPHGPGIFDPIGGRFHLRDENSSGSGDLSFDFGPPGGGWTPIGGDWNGDDGDSIGLFDPVEGRFYLRNTNTTGFADVVFDYGPDGSGWLPIVGDWNGDGSQSVGLYDPESGAVHIRDTNSTGVADEVFHYGPPGAGWIPIVCDWDGDGIETVGLYDPANGLFYLRNSNSTGVADVVLQFGPGGPGWVPICGDWDGVGGGSIGLYFRQTSEYFLRNQNTTGFADLAFTYGEGGWSPLTGHWAGMPVALRLDGPAASAGGTSPVADPGILTAGLSAALDWWQSAGLDPATASSLQLVQLEWADLPANTLALLDGATIRVDVDAAGYGWSLEDSFVAAGQVDLATVLAHEVGHRLGLDHLGASLDSFDLMNASLPTGTRRLPTKELIDRVMAEHGLGGLL